MTPELVAELRGGGMAAIEKRFREGRLEGSVSFDALADALARGDGQAERAA